MHNDGLGSYETKSIFLKVSEITEAGTGKLVGRIVKSSKVQNADGTATQRINKAGNTVFEEYYPFFTGTLVDIQTKMATEYGDKIIFSFVTNDGTSYTFDTSLYGSLADRLLKTLPNLDLSKKITIAPWIGDDDKLLITIKQGDTTIKPFYTKDEPNGLPNWTKVLKADGTPLMTNGKETWDKSACYDFLLGMVERDIRSKLALNGSTGTNVPVSTDTTTTGTISDVSDALTTVEAHSTSAPDTTVDDSLPF